MAGLATLSACSRPDHAGLERIACARGDAALTDSCTVEAARAASGLVLTVRWPDGGFRRLLMTHHARGVVAADGAEPAVVHVVGQGTMEVRVADERYRLRATIGVPR